MLKILPHSFFCPNCHIKLKGQRAGETYFWSCPNCLGRAVTNSYLKEIINVPIKAIINQSLNVFNREGKICCSCAKQMVKTELTLHDQSVLELDFCSTCKLVWFDKKEMSLYKEFVKPEQKQIEIKFAFFSILKQEQFWGPLFFIFSFIGFFFVQNFSFVISFFVPFSLLLFLQVFKHLPNFLIFGWPVLFARTDEIDTRIARKMVKGLYWIFFGVLTITSFRPHL